MQIGKGYCKYVKVSNYQKRQRVSYWKHWYFFSYFQNFEGGNGMTLSFPLKATVLNFRFVGLICWQYFEYLHLCIRATDVNYMECFSFLKAINNIKATFRSFTSNILDRMLSLVNVCGDLRLNNSTLIKNERRQRI